MMTPATLIETLARHPLHTAPLEVSFGTTVNGERTLRVWAPSRGCGRKLCEVRRTPLALCPASGCNRV